MIKRRKRKKQEKEKKRDKEGKNTEYSRTRKYSSSTKINLAVEAELCIAPMNLIKISSIADALSREKGSSYSRGFPLSFSQVRSKSNLGSTAGLPRGRAGRIILAVTRKPSGASSCPLKRCSTYASFGDVCTRRPFATVRLHLRSPFRLPARRA